MASITQPFNSKVRITPYSQRLLQYGIQDSRIFLSKATNSLLTPFVAGYSEQFLTEYNQHNLQYDHRTSCILDGLNSTYDFDNNIITLKISSGMCIVDTTLLIFPNETSLDLNLTGYGEKGSCGKLIVSANFQWVDSVHELVPKLKLSYLDKFNNDSVEPNGWLTAEDRLVITVLEFDKDENNRVIPESIINHVPNPITNTKREIILIKSVPYEIAPLSKIAYNLQSYIEENYPKKITTTIPPYVIGEEDGKDGYKINLEINFDNIPHENLIGFTGKLRITSNHDQLHPTEPVKISFSDEVLKINPEWKVNLNYESDTQILTYTFNTSPMVDHNLPKIKDFLNFTFYDNTTPVNNTEVTFEFVEFRLSQKDQENTIPVELSDLHPSATKIVLYRSNIPPLDLPQDQLSKVWTKLPDIPDDDLSTIYYISTIDISKIHNQDGLIVQTYLNNYKFNPAQILIANNQVKIYMPESFIKKSPIPTIKVVIIG